MEHDSGSVGRCYLAIQYAPTTYEHNLFLDAKAEGWTPEEEKSIA